MIAILRSLTLLLVCCLVGVFLPLYVANLLIRLGVTAAMANSLGIALVLAVPMVNIRALSWLHGPPTRGSVESTITGRSMSSSMIDERGAVTEVRAHFFNSTATLTERIRRWLGL